MINSKSWFSQCIIEPEQLLWQRNILYSFGLFTDWRSIKKIYINNTEGGGGGWGGSTRTVHVAPSSPLAEGSILYQFSSHKGGPVESASGQWVVTGGQMLVRES